MQESLRLALNYQLLSRWTNFLVIAERADKAEDLPELHQVPQMLAAGWGGTAQVRSGVRFCRRGRNSRLTPWLPRESIGTTFQLSCAGKVTMPSDAMPAYAPDTQSFDLSNVIIVFGKGITEASLTESLGKALTVGKPVRSIGTPRDAGSLHHGHGE
jgi:hypothetical protein